VRALGARAPHKASFTLLLDRMQVEEDAPVLTELVSALMRHFSVTTADRLLARTWKLSEESTGARAVAAVALLEQIRTQLSYTPQELVEQGRRLAEQYVTRRVETPPPAAAEPGDVIGRACELLAAGSRVAAVSLLQDSVRRADPATPIACAWLGAILTAQGQAPLAAEYFAKLAQATPPLTPQMDRVRAWCREQGLVPLPRELRERRVTGAPWSEGSGTRSAYDTVTQAKLCLPGRFDNVAHIGSGGMGIVFRARDLDAQADIAIKVLAPDHWHDQRAVKRFTLEARALARLSHPAVLRVLSIERGQPPYFTMELLDGNTLDELWPGPELPPARDVLRHLLPVLDALDHCHEAGLVHRDVKPRNIFVTRTGEVRLMDFGIVKAAGQSSVTSIGAIVGTPHYMAPEQLVGSRVDRRTDVFAFGVTLFQTLTGALPFADPGEVFNRPTPSIADWVEVPPELDVIVQRCLARSPGERFASCRELLAALKPLAGPEELVAHAPSSGDVLAAVLVECMARGGMGERELELVSAVRRLLRIGAEEHQQVFRQIQSRVRGERQVAGSPVRMPPETLYRMLVRCHLDAPDQDPQADGLLDAVGRLLEIPRPRRRELEREIADHA